VKISHLSISMLLLSAVFLGQQKDVQWSPSHKFVQSFVCNTGYKIQDCHEHLNALRSLLAAYPTEQLGTWTWVLVKTDDWKSIVQQMRGNTNSPAFSVLEKRETFLEAALFGADRTRRVELLRAWAVPLDKFLNVAVTHELGHAICNDLDEARADTFGRALREKKIAECANKRASTQAN
jgi:hypothetical protein